jgi:hypothetical protein
MVDHSQQPATNASHSYHSLVYQTSERRFEKIHVLPGAMATGNDVGQERRMVGRVAVTETRQNLL